ncbi:MAG: helix-hairpin-helix domain-containing protein, partial [Bacteroidales bacterium]|nr:helix-hairpin-helix domain-containing protein [Bacteroidales bacterium]
MRAKKSILLIFILWALPMFMQAQHDTTTADESSHVTMDDLENIIEMLTEQSDESPDYSELVDEWVYYAKNKMNLNNPDYSQLMNLFGLTDYQVYHLQRYLSLYGQMYSIYELKMVEGMDETTIARLLKYVDVYPVKQQQKLNLAHVFKYGKHRILMRYGQVLEQQQGYVAVADEVLEKRPNAVYLGSPQSYLFKYTFNYNNRIRFGLTAEKDAGEEFFKGSNKWGFDFYSFHLFARNMGVFKTIALGDYHASFGQGLVMSTGFSLYKPDNAIGIYKNPSGIRYYTSANEVNFLRGVAATLDCKVVEVTLFYSYKKIDGSLSDTVSNDELSIETLYQTGYHRTQGEVAKKNATGQHVTGVHLEHSMRVVRIGATACYTHFEAPLNR